MAASLYVSKAGLTVSRTVVLKSCTEFVRNQSTDISFSGNISKFKFTNCVFNTSSSFGSPLENHGFVVSAKANRGSKKTRSHSSKSVVIVDKDDEVADKQLGGEDNWDAAFTDEIKNKNKNKNENKNENENVNLNESDGWDVACEIESELNPKLTNGKTEVSTSKKKKGKKGKAVNEEKQAEEQQVDSTENHQVGSTENGQVVSAENNQVVSTGKNVAALIEHIFSEKFDELSTNGTPNVNQVEVLPAHKETFHSLITASLNKLHQDASEQLNQLNDSLDVKFVHDLRVTLRRLRTAVVTFEPFIDIPKEANAKRISKLLRVLGTLRDRDVMQETFKVVKDEAENMETVEVEHFKNVQKRMKAERAKMVSGAVNTLRSKSAVLFFQSLDNWLKKPCFKKEYRALVDAPSRLVVPALLLQHIASILSHPGWHIDDLGPKNVNGTPSLANGTKSSNGGGQLKRSKELLPGLDQLQCDTVHDLRKGLRELRYSMELLSSVYGERERYGNVLANIRKLQGSLGDLQDLQVLANYLDRKLSAKAPNIRLALTDSQNKAWSSWLEGRDILYQVSGQRKLIKVISRPKGPKKENIN